VIAFTASNMTGGQRSRAEGSHGDGRAFSSSHAEFYPHFQARTIQAKTAPTAEQRQHSQFSTPAVAAPAMRSNYSESEREQLR